MSPSLGIPTAAPPGWQRLLELLVPIHARAAGMARRLAGSAHDGDDLFQEAVLRAHQALPTLRDADRFGAWFYTILLSVHRNRHRRGFWRRFLPFDAGLPPGTEPVGEDGHKWEEERQAALRASRALAGLPAVQREAVVLFEIEGFSVEEIAALQQVSPSAVKSRLARGRARLRRTYLRWGFAPQRTHESATRGSTPMLPAFAPLVPEEDSHDRASRA
jgi:RNA polymerase sigma-70 factor (ECF subfamily)